MIYRAVLAKITMVCCIAFVFVGCEKGASEDQSPPPDTALAQRVVDHALGDKYKVIGIVPDGEMYRLDIGYHGYRITNIYLRSDQKTLLRAELVVPPTELQAKANQKHVDDREAYRNTINTALAKAGHKTSEQLQATQTRVKSEPITPPVLPRVNEAPDLSRLYQQLNGTEYVVEGSGERVLYVFDDYACPACRQAAKYLHALPDDLNLEVRHVPVGVLGPQSLALASYVLDSKSMDERAARGKTVRSDPNKIIESINSKDIKLSDPAVTSAMKNFQYLQEAGRGGTPTFIYLTNDGVRASVTNSEAGLRAIIDTIICEKS